MGRQLFDEDETFRRCLMELDEVSCDLTGRSVIKLLYMEGRGRGELCDQITFTHPAIFMVEYAVAQTLMQHGVYPDLVMGASLGCFAAAAIAGMLPVAEALAAVLQQAGAFDERCEPGGMLAVLEDAGLYEQAFLREQSTLASVNFDSHFTVSARSEPLARIERELQRRRLNFQRLPVRFAFHSPWIEQAKSSFSAFAHTLSSREGEIPMVCCSEPRILKNLPKQYLWDVVRQPMRFQEAVALLESQAPHRYIDAGPSGTLATFLKYGFGCKTRSTVHAVLTPFGFDKRNLAAITA